MKAQTFICYGSLFGLVVAIFTGCLSGKETTRLADGSTTETRIYSFWSESAIETLKSSKKMTSDSYERETGVDGISSEADTGFADKLITALAAQSSGGGTDAVEIVKAMREPQITESAIAKIIEDKLASASATNDK